MRAGPWVAAATSYTHLHTKTLSVTFIVQDAYESLSEKPVESLTIQPRLLVFGLGSPVPAATVVAAQ